MLGLEYMWVQFWPFKFIVHCFKGVRPSGSIVCSTITTPKVRRPEIQSLVGGTAGFLKQEIFDVPCLLQKDRLAAVETQTSTHTAAHCVLSSLRSSKLLLYPIKHWK